MNDTWISTKDWAVGNFGLPPKTESAQAHIRSKKKIKYTKNGRNVIYLKSWIMDYLNSNIRKAQPKAE